jgi:spore germination cell wall hydrolase CwlJ-like protein
MTFKLATIILMGLMPKTASMPKINEQECLAKNIYYEAPDESYEGKLAVATVTMNRAKSKEWPKTVCGVVYQKGQFSWTAKPYPIRDMKIYKEAMRIAHEVLFENKRLPTIKNAMFFHNMSVKPKWSLTMLPIQQIGGHIFYVTEGT